MTVISLRPDLDQNVDALPLYVAGLLPGGKPLLAYEGRLQIKNPSGPCTVVQIGGDALPPGTSISVDSDTMEVVVAWPAYSEHVTPLANPGFETGDTSGWSFTPRGGGGVPVADSVYRYEGAHSLRWPGGRGLGSEGGIEVEVWSNTIGPCLPGQRVTSHARCMYNPAGHNFGNRYQGLLRFLDGAGVPIGNAVRGKLFKGRGNNGRWNDASATGIGPEGTKAVQMGAWLTGSNAPAWLDAASWDVPSSLGISTEGVIQLVLMVRDSAGRTALWSGNIEIKNSNPIALSIHGKVTTWWDLGEAAGSRLDSLGRVNLVPAKFGSAGITTMNGPRGVGDIAVRYPAAGCVLLDSGDVSYMNVPADGDFSIFGWFYVDNGSTGRTQVLASRWNGLSASGMQYLVDVEPDGRLRGVSSNGGSYTTVFAPVKPTSGAWHFFVMWRDKADDLIRLQLDDGAVAISGTGSNPTVADPVERYAQGDLPVEPAGNFSLIGGQVRCGWVKGQLLAADERTYLFNAGQGVKWAELLAAAGL